MSVSLVSHINEMSPSWFTALLNDAQLLGGGGVRSVDLQPFGGGVMTSMVRAVLTYEDSGPQGPESLLVKFPSADEGNRGIAELMGLYELEVRFYRDVAPLLTELATPKCYFAEIEEGTGRFTLVLEDCSGNTRPGTMLTTLSVEECSAALAELANFQTPLWNSPRLDSISWLQDSTRTYAVFDAVSAGLEPFLKRFGPSLKEEYVELFKTVLPKAGEWVRGWQAPRVLQHGEFRAGNILLATDASASPVIVIDFQTVRVGPPGVDLAYFMGGSMPAADRREMEQKVVKSYHGQLVKAGISDFSWEDCWQSYREGALYGVFLLVGMAGQVEASERNDQVILGLTRQFAEMAIDLESAAAAGLA